MDKGIVARFCGPQCTYDLHYNFGRAPTVEKVNHQLFFTTRTLP